MKWILVVFRSLYFKVLAGICVCLFFLANYRVYAVSNGHVHDDLKKLKTQETALLLGTSKRLKNGEVNAYFEHRIEACFRLYSSGKVRRILISGDNSHTDYNEPQDMKDALVGMGIPSDKIYLDYAGFDTFDSVLRAREIFGQAAFIVVSQRFQNERAVYIARRYGIDASGYNAGDVHKMAGFKTRVREYFARVKAYIEVNLGVQPYFLGERIKMS